MSRLSDAVAASRSQATAAECKLRAALARAGVVLPSLCVDRTGMVTGVTLVELGRATAETTEVLADLILEGVNARNGRTN
ncbi:hypothetical protein C7C46_02315 [Streptomyces tateyamensis]|uniref:Uncharacterized protein n=1 Tax=Streptomyces tateyamensis TaxID=565073 RepID=A0A2V4PNL8_9ACTN|nr:hypothetical protein [Streptomyces tateyamensis]PYC87894.1 hypothetical protein C7C46_02315 [Streptomyces tateyamensis]